MKTTARREVVALLATITLGSLGAFRTRVAFAQDQGSQRSAEEWMNAWMDEVRAVRGALHVSKFAEAVWFLTRPIRWEPNADHGQDFEAVTVPAGFITDLASIPPIFFSILRPDGLYTYPAIVHDFLYWTQTTSRRTA